MKNYILVLTLIIHNLLLFSQSPQFQTYSADLLIIATKEGEDFQWQNKDIVVTLNYKTGNFKVIINNNDFYNKETNGVIIEDSISNNNKFFLVDILPIDRIIDQKIINQDYDIELQLTNEDISLSKMLNFKMNVMRPNQTTRSYRVFTLTGILYNDELNLPAFTGYDNEVEIRIIFNGFWSG
jgi:hypothetical protein